MMEREKKDVMVLIGSESDAEKANIVLAIFQKLRISYRMGIASCHRNIDGEFEQLARQIDEPIIMMIGGMTFAAPGIMSSILRNQDRFKQIVFAVPLDEAARSAIEDLPKGTVVLTCGLNQVSLGHTLVNSALAVAQLAVMLGTGGRNQPAVELALYHSSLRKPLIPEIELVDGLIPLPKKQQ